MFSVIVMTVGKCKESFYLSACDEYLKRLKGYCDCKVLELPETRLPDNPSAAEIQAGLKKEGDLILEKLPKNAWFCVCTPEGTQQSSEELSETLQKVKGSGASCACFLIGSSFGIDSRVKLQANCRLSVSKMTFPHHLFRVMLLEQLYRAQSIEAGSRYHK